MSHVSSLVESNNKNNEGDDDDDDDKHCILIVPGCVLSIYVHMHICEFTHMVVSLLYLGIPSLLIQPTLD